MKKKVPNQVNQVRFKNGTFTVYSYICRGIPIKKLWENKVIPKRTLLRYLKLLSDSGYIKKVAYGTWEVTEKKYPQKEGAKNGQIKFDVGKLLEPEKVAPSFIRGHAFVVRQEIPRLKNWDKRLQRLEKAKIPFRAIRQGASVKVGDIENVHLCSKSIVWYMRGLSFFGETPTIAYNNALEFLIAHIRKLENMIGIGAHNLKIRKGYKLFFSRQHYALIKNALAQKYNDEGKKLYVFDENGLWLIIDKSYNVDELEGVRNDTSLEEISFMRSYFNDLNKTRLMPSTALQIMTGNAQNMGTYSKELMAHVDVVKTLGVKTSDFTSAVIGFKDEIKVQLGKLVETITAQSRPESQDKLVSVKIIKDTGKFYSILNGETHLYDLKEGAKIYLSQQCANTLIRNGFARKMRKQNDY